MLGITRLQVSFDTIEWANDADINPEFVYNESSPMKKIL